MTEINGKVIPRILGPVLTVTLWAALISYLAFAGYKVSLTNSVVPLLSVVVRSGVICSPFHLR
jgi:ion channel-forming bestrophin family protein